MVTLHLFCYDTQEEVWVGQHDQIYNLEESVDVLADFLIHNKGRDLVLLRDDQLSALRDWDVPVWSVGDSMGQDLYNRHFFMEGLKQVDDKYLNEVAELARSKVCLL